MKLIRNFLILELVSVVSLSALASDFNTGGTLEQVEVGTQKKVSRFQNQSEKKEDQNKSLPASVIGGLAGGTGHAALNFNHVKLNESQIEGHADHTTSTFIFDQKRTGGTSDLKVLPAPSSIEKGSYLLVTTLYDGEQAREFVRKSLEDSVERMKKELDSLNNPGFVKRGVLRLSPAPSEHLEQIDSLEDNIYDNRSELQRLAQEPDYRRKPIEVEKYISQADYASYIEKETASGRKVLSVIKYKSSVGAKAVLALKTVKGAAPGAIIGAGLGAAVEYMADRSSNHATEEVTGKRGTR